MTYFDLAVALTRAEAEPTLKKVATKYRAIQKIAAHDEDEDAPICGNCNGSGEGMHDGSRCYACGGSGVVSSMTREEIEDAKADAYNDARHWRDEE